jgi:hypothetical protein
VLLAMGLVVAGLALWATSTRIESASNGLLLIGGSLFLLGGGLMGLDWMGSYTAAAEGSWDHHMKPSSALAARRSPSRHREADSSHRRGRRMGLFAHSRQASEFADSVALDMQPTAQPQPSPPAQPQPLPPSHPAVAEAIVASRVPVVPLQSPAAPEPAPAAPVQAPSVPAVRNGPPAPAQEALPLWLEEPARGDRSDPGPDTVIDEFVGYEGQDRMLAAQAPAAPASDPQTPVPHAQPISAALPSPLRRAPVPLASAPAAPAAQAQAPRAPRELAWPNPPRQAVDVSPDGNEAFLEKLMDDVLAKIGSHAGGAAPAASAPSADAAAAHPGGPVASASVPQPLPAPLPLPPAPAPTPPLPVWTVQTLHGADHWRFAALVEKLYQQAGFATQLQAGQTLGGVVVLWLFSRHRPGMPASVVRCVHAPGQALAAEEILSLAELVQTRGLPRGQLATTATVNVACQQLAATHQVHLMDTQRLLELITRRTAEQQRALAGRLA